MTHYYIYRKSITALCALLYSASLSAAQHSMTVKVTNDWGCQRADEPVVVNLRKVKRLAFDVKSATVTLNGKSIPCQLDDMDGDTRADELVFLADIDANATNEYEVTLSDNTTESHTVPRVWAALVLRDRKDAHPKLSCVEAPGESNLFNDIHMHGAVMESELVGWRVYFDQRQNLDLYGKRHRRIEIPETEFYTTAEQLQQGYGVDVLWAGGAIGCGTFRGWNDGPTLIDDVKTRGQRIVAAGPVRTVVEVKDCGWRVKPSDSNRVNMRQRYTMYAGHRDMEIAIDFDGAASGNDFCTGVQKVGVTASDSVRRGHTPEGFVNTDGLAAAWGCDYPDMGKKQMWPPEAIGLATYVPAEHVKSVSESDLNYLLVLSAPKSAALSYHTAFCADKEEHGFHSASEWFAWAKQWKESLQHPLTIKYK